MRVAEFWVDPLPGWNATGYGYLEWVPSQNVRHPAIDFNRDVGWADFGDPVVAMGAGVLEAFWLADGGWGNHLLLRHLLHDGRFIWTHYAHLLAGWLLGPLGRAVDVGEQIARVGRSGTKSPHLHAEVQRIRMGRSYPIGRSREWVAARYADPLNFVAVQNALRRRRQEHQQAPKPPRRRRSMDAFVFKPGTNTQVLVCIDKASIGISRQSDKDELVRAMLDPTHTADVGEETYAKLIRAAPLVR